MSIEKPDLCGILMNALFSLNLLGKKEGENKMRVLVIIGRIPAKRYLIKLHTEELINEVRELINKSRHSQAITAVLTKGRFEREVLEGDLPTLEADVILSKNTARWDLTG